MGVEGEGFCCTQLLMSGFFLWCPLVIQGLQGPHGRHVWAVGLKGAGKRQIARTRRERKAWLLVKHEIIPGIEQMLTSYHFGLEKEHQ